MVAPPSFSRVDSEELNHRSDTVHGTVMGLMVVLIFPLGAMSWKTPDHIISPLPLALDPCGLSDRWIGHVDHWV